MFCRYCGKEIHESAVSCPNCGGMQKLASNKSNNSAHWTAIISSILGTLVLLACADDSEWDRDMLIGGLLMGLPGLIFGITSLIKGFGGKGWAIYGVTVSSIALLCLAGYSAN